MTNLFKRTFILGLLLACGLTAGLAQAKPLDAGTFYIEPKVGIYGNSNDRINSMFTYGAEVGYFLVDGFSLGFEGQGYIISQRRYPNWSWGGSSNDETVNAFSPIGIARWHFINEEKFSLFAGVGLGGFFSGTKVPRNGYDSNLTEVVEAGGSVFFNDHMSLLLAARWQHIGEFSSKGADNWGGNLAFKYSF